MRPMREEDSEAVIALWQACGLTRPWNDPVKDIAYARGKANSDVLVGEEDGKIIASAMIGHDGHRGTLYYVAVAPERQGAGLGSLVVRAAEEWLRERGVWKINLLVRTENARVKRFYERLGYEISDVFCMARRVMD